MKMEGVLLTLEIVALIEWSMRSLGLVYVQKMMMMMMTKESADYCWYFHDKLISLLLFKFKSILFAQSKRTNERKKRFRIINRHRHSVSRSIHLRREWEKILEMIWISIISYLVESRWLWKQFQSFCQLFWDFDSSIRCRCRDTPWISVVGGVNFVFILSTLECFNSLPFLSKQKLLKRKKMRRWNSRNLRLSVRWSIQRIS